MKRQAFTLIELLVVVAIIAILAAILIPTLSRANALANATRCRGNLQQLGQALRLYVSDYGGYMPIGQQGGTQDDASQYVVGDSHPVTCWKSALNDYLVGRSEGTTGRYTTTTNRFAGAHANSGYGIATRSWDWQPAGTWVYAPAGCVLGGSRGPGNADWWVYEYIGKTPAAGQSPQTGIDSVSGPTNLGSSFVTNDFIAHRLPSDGTGPVTYAGFSPVWICPVPGKGRGQYMTDNYCITGRDTANVTTYRTMDQFANPTAVPFLAETYGPANTGLYNLYWPDHSTGAATDPPAPNPLDYRHPTGTHVLFLDGHVEAVKKEDFLTLVKKWATIQWAY